MLIVALSLTFTFAQKTEAPAAEKSIDFIGQSNLSGAIPLPLLEFGPEKKPNEFGLFFFGSLMSTGFDKFLMFTYAGFDLKLANWNLKFLGGSYTSAGGASADVSIWITGSDLIVEGLSIFGEFDVVPNIYGHDELLLYGVTSMQYEVRNELSPGVQFEYFGSPEDIYELAVGPKLNAGPIGIWLAYDIEARAVTLRVTIGVSYKPNGDTIAPRPNREAMAQ